ncbi:MAG: prepilin-type N-terminal cleavage/methylation domain-containing protein [Candidatus Eremiobacterota bacterium]
MRKPGGFTLIELMIVIAIIAILAAILVPNFIKARAQAQLSGCKSNLKNIGTALEMYSTDFGGHYPPSLDELEPNYMKEIPDCPSFGDDTYKAGYVSASVPDAYTVVCSGANHKGAGITVADYPQYNSTQGLVERP